MARPYVLPGDGSTRQDDEVSNGDEDVQERTDGGRPRDDGRPSPGSAIEEQTMHDFDAACLSLAPEPEPRANNTGAVRQRNARH